MTNKKRIGITVPITLYTRLRDEADYTGNTINALIRNILWKREGKTENDHDRNHKND